MEATALAVTLVMNVWWLLLNRLEAAAVTLDAPLLPVMEGDDVTLRCRNPTLSNATADFYKDEVLIRSSDTGNLLLLSVSTSDEGLYKCHISGAGASPSAWLHVTVAAVTLESPARPVAEGDSATLRCRTNRALSNRIADFYKRGVLVGTGYNGEMSLHNVTKADEGFYKCSISGAGESAERWLHVRAVVLEVPALPVLEGEDVTLRCGHMIGTNTTASFYKDGLFIGGSSSGNMTIHSVTKSDAGSYRCHVSGAQASSETWLSVRECPQRKAPLCYDQLPVLLYLLMRTMVTVIWVVLLLLVLRRRHREEREDFSPALKKTNNKFSFSVM